MAISTLLLLLLLLLLLGLTSRSLVRADPTPDALRDASSGRHRRASRPAHATKRPRATHYTLTDTYDAGNFFDRVDFFTDVDPTHGFVQYLDRAAATSASLISTAGHEIYMGVDFERQTPDGRPSVRVTTQQVFNKGLIIADILHMPGGVCGTWPAFWTLGPNWPANGELDILEGVHDQRRNRPAFHTATSCPLSGAGQTGPLITANCNVHDPTQPNNAGCQAEDPLPNSYGRGFNANGGGVYAMQWTSAAVRVWFFPRARIPADIRRGAPHPERWGTPSLNVEGGCDLDSVYRDQQIV
ncbi:MAG: hypothetical protein M1826_006473 [Phylliscum demangeonii]|nr:MAG: hypothetical protein M1826_006473 [Phylliscum demangeonii]